MNRFRKNLWQDLMTLVEREAFFFKDFTLGPCIYRTFNYRLASYTDFLEPGALECRGVMFEVSKEGHPLRLAALPPEKFFNLGENPMTMDLDLSAIVDFEEKADGSLMSSYYHNDGECTWPMLKSKGSIESEQCLHAMAWLVETVNTNLYCDIKAATERGWTVNLEWCAPQHRIVLGYEKPHLQVLNVRNNETGEYLRPDQMQRYDTLLKHMVGTTTPDDPAEFIASIPDMQGIEGYVVRFASGQRVKIKTEWYKKLHFNKESVNCPRRLYEAVVYDTTDDLRSMFTDDFITIKIIEDMEIHVQHIFNHIVEIVERFHEENKNLERKEYAILGQKKLTRPVFSLAMTKYSGREVNYEQFMVKHFDIYKPRELTEEPLVVQD